MSGTEAFVREIVRSAGIEVNGSRPWDIQVHDKRFYAKVLDEASVGLGESYMDGWWDCDKVDKFIYRLLTARLERKVNVSFTSKIFRTFLFQYLDSVLFNRQSKSRAFEAGRRAYDVMIYAYTASLDKRQAYSCGYWKNAKNLDQAQEAKLELICRKIGLKHGMTVLDIGCGVGSFIKYAAERYKAKCVGITVSNEQAGLGRKLCKGLPVTILVQDYRDVEGSFDRVVSVGMFEHVGIKNYTTFMQVVNRVLKDDGLFLLHTIGRTRSSALTDPWMDKYIFPNGILPSLANISKASEGLFVIEDVHNFGSDYDKTLMAWHANFVRNWPKIASRYDERFYRMWNYYLMACAATFRARNAQLWQIVFSKSGVPGGYISVR